GLDAQRKSGWRGFWLTARARVLVVTHGFGDVNRYATRGAFVAQLWHGIPLKRLHLDSPAALRISFLPDHRLVRAVVARAYRLAGRGISLFPVASQLVVPRIASAFGISRDRIVVTGDPRDDVLLTGTAVERRAAALEALAPGSARRRILYAPTWRDGAVDPSAPDSGTWNEIIAWLDATDSELWLRTHPLGKGDYAGGAERSERIRLLGMDQVADVTPLLPAFDALVTDYSSIAYDFALVGAPIVFLAPDVETYAKSRGLYEAYRDFSGGRHVTSWRHALTLLDERLGAGTPSRIARGPHETWLRNEHFDHLDGAASRRVLDTILARLEGRPVAVPQQIPRPAVTRIETTATAVNVTLSAKLDGLRLEGARASVDGRIEGTLVSGTTTATFPLLTTRWGAAGLALPSGEYRLTITGTPPTTRVDVEAEVPAHLLHDLFHATVNADAGGLVIRVAAPLTAAERGPANQKRLERRYRRSGAATEDAVFLESFYGQSASDNPLGIDRALAALRPSTTRYWSVADGSVAIPEGGVRVIEGSSEWWRARGSARVLIVNDWLRKRFRRRAGQHVLQTWHGTMLKRLALDRDPGVRTRIAIQRERSRWSALLAQNEYSARIFRSAYAMRDAIWQDGYPRNDILQLPAADLAARRDSVRAAVGVPAGARVVLYAPTWRDDRTEMVDYVDLRSFAAELGDDHVLLVRGHSRTLRYGQDLAGDRLIDVTSYPSMTELLLLADVLVTDYSSVMFDFAGTGKPIVFFTPDLAHYSTDLRGFYFDLLAEAPGAVVHEREDLRDAILATRSVGGGRDAAARARADAWRERFTPLDDGHAGARVVQRMLDAGWFDPLG
ncbi:MAG TPA: CDP-glycerol glycerophosphotransferase family protein, partial [Pseudolysinimonas sp.]|nr:CDP-glycerol glycerophosphotransferase family protein [Pseudolysinimonas sp.]